MKAGTKVITPDGAGVVQKIIGNPPKENQVLVKIESNKYWPHWNIYYDTNEIKETNEWAK